MQIEEGVIPLSRRLRQITPSKICIILHIIRKPNPIIVLLFIKNQFSKFLRKTKFTLLSSETNCKVENIQQFSLQILILRGFFCFCYLYHSKSTSFNVSNIACIHPFSRFLALQYQSHCRVTSIVQIWTVQGG